MKLIQKQRPLSQAKTLLFTLFNKNLNTKKRLMILAVILYIVSPVDVIPDFVPFVGYADDVILPIVLFLINKFLLEDKETENDSLDK